MYPNKTFRSQYLIFISFLKSYVHKEKTRLGNFYSFRRNKVALESQPAILAESRRNCKHLSTKLKLCVLLFLGPRPHVLLEYYKHATNPGPRIVPLLWGHHIASPVPCVVPSIKTSTESE